jgi:hypothetical protein
MLNKLIKFRRHIKTEHYNLKYYPTPADFQKRFDICLNPSEVTAIEARVDDTFDSQQLFYVSSKDYCLVYTTGGQAWEIDGSLDDISKSLMLADGYQPSAHSQPR